MAVEPDVIFIGGRLKAEYQKLEEIAPVVYLASDVEEGVVKSAYESVNTVAKIFGEESKVEEAKKGLDGRINTLKEKANGANALVTMANGGKISLLGDDGRCSIIGREIGFTSLSNKYIESTSTHGEVSNWEFIAGQNPDYIFNLDRDAAIATEGATPAKDILNNDFVNNTNAGKNGRVIVLEHSNIWYTAEGGIQALDIMLKDSEKVLLD